MKTRPLLKITLLDVGWGDALFLETIDGQGDYHFGFIDSNDTKYSQTSANFLKRYFRRHRYYVTKNDLQFPGFDFVLLTHDHNDHRSGLKKIIQTYGTQDFWYPKSRASADLTSLLHYAEKEIQKHNGKVNHHEAVERGKPLGRFGDVDMEVLWPPEDYDFENSTVNNTSVVLKLNLGKWNMILTGDAEEEVWTQVGSLLPNNIRFFKVPHHGSINGTDPDNPSSWYNRCSSYSRIGLSCDIRSTIQIFPSKIIIDRLEADKRQYFRTDLHHHVTFITDGEEYRVIYSH